MGNVTSCPNNAPSIPCQSGSEQTWSPGVNQPQDLRSFGGSGTRAFSVGKQLVRAFLFTRVIQTMSLYTPLFSQVTERASRKTCRSHRQKPQADIRVFPHHPQKNTNILFGRVVISSIESNMEQYHQQLGYEVRGRMGSDLYSQLRILHQKWREFV